MVLFTGLNRSDPRLFTTWAFKLKGLAFFKAGQNGVNVCTLDFDAGRLDAGANTTIFHVITMFVTDEALRIVQGLEYGNGRVALLALNEEFNRTTVIDRSTRVAGVSNLSVSFDHDALAFRNNVCSNLQLLQDTGATEGDRTYGLPNRYLNNMVFNVLPESCNQFVSLMSRQPDISFHDMLAALCEFFKLELSRHQATAANAILTGAVLGLNLSREQGKERKLKKEIKANCTNCNKSGHSKVDCWDLYPEKLRAYQAAHPKSKKAMKGKNADMAGCVLEAEFAVSDLFAYNDGLISNVGINSEEELCCMFTGEVDEASIISVVPITTAYSCESELAPFVEVWGSLEGSVEQTRSPKLPYLQGGPLEGSVGATSTRSPKPTYPGPTDTQGGWSACDISGTTEDGFNVFVMNGDGDLRDSIIAPTFDIYLSDSSQPTFGPGAVAVDSGAGRSLCRDRKLMHDLVVYGPSSDAPRIKVASGEIASATGVGTMELIVNATHKSKEGLQLIVLRVTNTLFFPMLQLNLVAVGALTYHGRDSKLPTNNLVVFGGAKSKLILQSGWSIPLELRGSNLFYFVLVDKLPELLSVEAPVEVLAVTEVSGFSTSPTSVSPNEMQRLHEGLGHINFPSVQRQYNVKSKDVPTCDDCLTAKTTRQPLPYHTSLVGTAELPGQVTFIDLGGPYQVPGLNGERYVMVFVDDKSDKGTTYFLQGKAKLDRFMELHVQRVSVFRAIPPMVIGRGSHFHSDNELITKAAEAFCATKGISQSSTPPYTPQLNPIPESYINVLLGYVRVMIYAAKLSLSYWPLAWGHAEYLKERSPRSLSPHSRPIDVYGQKQSPAQILALSKLPPFGVKAFVSVAGHKGAKLDPKARPGVFVGVSDQHSSLVVYFPDTNTCVFTIHVRFGGFTSPDPVPQQPSVYLSDIMSFATAPGVHVAPVVVPAIAAPAAPGGPAIVIQPGPPGALPQADNNNEPPEDVLLSEAVFVPHSPTTFDELIFLSTLVEPEHGLPRTYVESQQSKDAAQWEQGMQVQLAAFKKYDTFLPLFSSDILSTDVPIHSMVVFKLKYGLGGKIDQYKVRLVVCGNEQTPYIHFDPKKIHSPVAGLSSGRLQLSLMSVLGLYGKLFDIEQAFLQTEEITQRIVVKLPRGVKFEKADHVLMKRSSFGLRQAPKEWYKVLDRALVQEFGMAQSPDDPCVYTHAFKQPDQLLITIIVDDITAVCLSLSKLEWFEDKLRHKFNLSKAESFGLKPVIWLGLEVTYDQANRVVTITAGQFIDRLLVAHGMADCSSSPTPMPAGTNMLQDFSTLPKLSFSLNKQFQSLTGSLIYLGHAVRLDISYAANTCAQYMSESKSNKVHLAAAKHVLKYLRGTKLLGLVYRRPLYPPMLNQLISFADSSFGGDRGNARSTGGQVIMCNGGAIAWSSNRHKMVTLSTAEAETVQLSILARMLVSKFRLCGSMSMPQRLPLIVFEDNTAAIRIAESDLLSSRTKHMDVRELFVREKIEDGLIRLFHCPSPEMSADIFTKALEGRKFIAFRDTNMGYVSVKFDAEWFPRLVGKQNGVFST